VSSDITIKTLNLSSNSFKTNDSYNGYIYFDSCLPKDRDKVYEQIWIDRNQPDGDPEYGMHAFRDCCGQSSSNQEKAIAIDRYIDKFNNEDMKNNQRLWVNSNYSPTGTLSHRTDPQKYDVHGNFTQSYIDIGFKNLKDFGENMPHVPPEYENAARAAILGVGVLSIGVFVADFIRKASGH
jgi:hypothetical protein